MFSLLNSLPELIVSSSSSFLFFFIIIYSFVDESKNFAAVVRLRRKYISLLLIFYGKQFDVSLYYRPMSIYIKFLYLID